MRSLSILVLVGVFGCGSDPSTARVTVNPHALLADGRSTATVTVTLRGATGESVSLEVEGAGAELSSLTGVTDEQGVYQTTLRATQGGQARVRARVGGQSPEATLQVVALAPACASTWTMPGRPMVQLTNPGVVADFDRDGIVDLASVDAGKDGADAVYVARGRGDGTFTQGAATPSWSSASTTFASDLDRDGALDLVTTDSVGARAIIRRGRGDGTFEAASFVSVPSAGEPRAPVDVDGDGVLDLVTAERVTVTVLRGDGTGGFPTRATTAVSQQPARDSITSATFADFDDDGWVDGVLAIQNYDGPIALRAVTRRVVYIAGNGDGTFDPPMTIAVTPGLLTALDYDVDGRPDLVSITADGVALHRRRSDGTFDAAVVHNHPGASRVRAGDLDGDGRLDLVLGGATVGVLRATAPGVFADAVSYAVGTATFGVAIADVDGDSDLDVVATGTERAAILRNDGSGALTAPARVTSAAPSSAIATVDLDADAVPDLVGARDNVVIALHGVGDGTFVETPIATVDGAVEAITTADFDRDGRSEIAAVDPLGVTILRVTDDGASVTARLAFGGEPRRPTHAIGDFTNDGILDILVSDAVGFGLVLHVGAGDATFPSSVPVPRDDAGRMGTDAGIAADLDGDGNLDLVATNTFSVAVMLGGGDGTFGPPIIAPIELRSPFVVADIDDDGHPDVVAGTQTSDQLTLPSSVHVLLGAGDGSLRPAGAAVLTPMTSIWQLATTDVDRDGQLDVVAPVGSSALDVVVLRGDGAGQLAPSITYPAGTLVYPPDSLTRAVGRVAELDADADGRVDVVMSDGTLLLQGACVP